MSLSDVFTLIVAVWGAGLATYLAIREVRKEKRQVRVYLDYIAWYEVHEITVVNAGQRPVTIVSVGAHLQPKDKSKVGLFEGRPFEPDTAPEANQPTLPARLADGDKITFVMSRQFRDLVTSGEHEAFAYARDAEGNTYISSSERLYDAKRDHYVPLPKNR
jgi:hypothetical protein